MKGLTKGYNLVVLALGGFALIAGVLAILAMLVAPLLAKL